MYSCETSFILVSIVIEQQLQLAGIYHLLLSNITTVVDTCLLAKFEGGLNVLHEADDDAVIWLESKRLQHSQYNKCPPCAAICTAVIFVSSSCTYSDPAILLPFLYVLRSV